MTAARVRAALGAIALAWAVPLCCVPGVVWGEVFYYRDTWQYFWPLRELAGTELAAGRVPLWTSQMGAGMPLLAGPGVGAAYPLNVMLAWLPSGTGLTWYLLLHLVIAGLGARALARAHGAGVWGGVLAGIAYAGSGPLLSHTSSANHACAAAWIPLACLAAHRLAQGGGARWAVAAAASVALIVLGGESQMALYTGAAMAATVLAHGGEGLRRGGGWLAGAAVLAGALAAVQVLPTLEWMGQVATGVAGRPDAPVAGRVMTWGDATATSWRPDLLAADLLWPGLLGNPAREQFFTSSGVAPRYVLQAFAGVAVLWLALLAGRPLARDGRAPAVWAAGAAWIAMGKYAGLYWLCFNAVPGFDNFRYPDKSLPFLALGLAVLAARGLRRWITERPRDGASFDGRDRALGIAVAIALLGAVVLLVVGAPSALPEAGSAWRWAAGRGLALALGAGAILYLARPGRALHGTGRPGAAIAVLALLECAVVNGPVAPTEPRGPWLEPSLVAQAAGRPGPGTWRTQVVRAPYGGTDLTAWNLARRRHGAYGGALLDGMATLGIYDTTRLRGYVETVEQTASVEWLGALGVRWFATERPLGRPPEGLRLLEAAPGLEIYEVAPALPRARLVGAVEQVEGLAAARRALLAPDFPHAERVVVEQPVAGLEPPGPAARAEVTADTGARVVIATTSAGRALCCLADLDYPGWEVTVDGAPAGKVVVNRAYRGVVVPAGRHIVEWRLRSAPARWGGWISLLAWLAAAACVFVVARRRSH